MRPLKLAISEDRRAAAALQAYSLRRWLRVAGIRNVLGSIGLAGLAALAWFTMSLLPLQRIEEEVRHLFAAALSRALEATAAEIGLGEVSGAERTSREEIERALGLPMAAAWLAVDTDEARAKVEELRWIGHAEVRVNPPDRIDVKVREQVAAAVWEREGEAWLLTEAGERIARAEGEAAARGLPVLQGAGADAAVGEILALGVGHPALLREFRRFRRIGSRRWDGELQGGVAILFPEGDLTESADLLVAINRASGLLERDVAAIDLRNPRAVAVRYRGADLERFLEWLRRPPGEEEQGA